MHVLRGVLLVLLVGLLASPASAHHRPGHGQGPKPTPVPTAEPSEEPTEEATPAPAAEPSEEPSEEPTAEATPAPTAEPPASEPTDVSANSVTSYQCTRTIPTSQEEVTSAEPGDVLCLEAGTRGELQLEGLVGTAAEPITVVNSGGVVRIHAPGDYAAIEVESSEHVRVTGTGQAAQCGATAAVQQCGIVLSGAGRGVAAKVLPRHLSFDHLEIHDVSGAGVTIKDNDQPRGSFVARDIVLRDSYLHDIGDEAVYIGSSDYATGTPHLLDGVHVDRNRVVNTGRDGLQVGSTPWNCTMNGNVVRNVGLNGESSHQFGIIVNRGASCDVIGNDIAGAPRSGIYDQGLHGQVIADNVIRDVGETGINVRDGNQSPDNPETRDYPNSTHILRNAIDGARHDGIRLGNDDGTDNRIDDNTFKNVGGWLIHLSSGVTATLSGNGAG